MCRACCLTQRDTRHSNAFHLVQWSHVKHRSSRSEASHVQAHTACKSCNCNQLLPLLFQVTQPLQLLKLWTPTSPGPTSGYIRLTCTQNRACWLSLFLNHSQDTHILSTTASHTFFWTRILATPRIIIMPIDLLSRTPSIPRQPKPCSAESHSPHPVSLMPQCSQQRRRFQSGETLPCPPGPG